MIRNVMKVSALAAMVAALGACEKQLEVTNPNSPETRRVLATPSDAEALLSGYYKRWHDGLYNGTGNFHGMANMLSFATYSSLANNCLNGRTPFTGSSNTNNPGNVCSGEQSRVYFVEGEVNRVASSVLKQLNDPTFSLGSPAQNLRARAFAEFLNGLSLGYVAMFYDSAAVISQNMGAEDAGSLVDYQTVMDSAQAAFQRSLDAANDPISVAGGLGGFPIPATWIPSPTSMTVANFVRLVRSYRARLTTNVGRTPAERAAPCWFAAGARTCSAAMWDNIIADAQNGISADHLNTTSTTNGPFYSWLSQNEAFSTWHQMPAFIIGMGDASGVNYDAWVKTDISARSVPFHMVTPDLRFPQGVSRANQQSDFAISSCAGASQVCKRYFVNRASGGDQFVGAGWGFSEYDFVRFHSWVTSGATGSARNGDLPFFTKAELDMIQAEGLIRRNTGSDLNNAAILVNATRSINGLSSFPTTGMTLTTASGDCVPRIPSGAGATGSTSCANNIWEAMKWEKRIESQYTHFAAWFLDSRGWGDLPKDTPLFWATPFQDQQARGRAVSALYGAGIAPGSAPNSATTTVGTYGY